MYATRLSLTATRVQSMYKYIPRCHPHTPLIFYIYTCIQNKYALHTTTYYHSVSHTCTCIVHTYYQKSTSHHPSRVFGSYVVCYISRPIDVTSTRPKEIITSPWRTCYTIMQGSKISPNYQRPSLASGKRWILDSDRAVCCRPRSDMIIPCCACWSTYTRISLLDRIFVFPAKRVVDSHIKRSNPHKLESGPRS